MASGVNSRVGPYSLIYCSHSNGTLPQREGKSRFMGVAHANNDITPLPPGRGHLAFGSLGLITFYS